MNKGILCGTCNEAFSPLDAALARQLSDLNGLIGVRRDRDDEPRPARAQGDEGGLLIDHLGKPSLDGPRVVRDEQLPDGKRAVSVEFPDNQTAQRWVAEQRALGRDVQTLRRSAGQRFAARGAAISWSFGGDDAFREVGRIALNFLAHQWPDVARRPDLKSFKRFVRGPSRFRCALLRVVQWVYPRHFAAKPQRVWYAPADAFPMPTSPFGFGHQVLLKIGDACAYARVRFFLAFDLFVWFGPLRGGVKPAAIIVDIDPLADRAPDDVRFSELRHETLPATIDRPGEHRDVGDLLRARMLELLSRIEDHQWSASTAGLLDQINATRAAEPTERADLVERALEPHLGRILVLARHIAGAARSCAQTDAEKFTAEQLETLTAGDSASHDGLTALSRTSLRSAACALAEAIAQDLEQQPLDAARLRLLLQGGPGAAIICGGLARHIIAAYEGS
jgi:hypothetical protein